jgi:hypothetical protein
MFGMIRPRNKFTNRTMPGVYASECGTYNIQKVGSEWEVWREDNHAVTTIFETLRDAAAWVQSEIRREA